MNQPKQLNEFNLKELKELIVAAERGLWPITHNKEKKNKSTPTKQINFTIDWFVGLVELNGAEREKKIVWLASLLFLFNQIKFIHWMRQSGPAFNWISFAFFFISFVGYEPEAPLSPSHFIPFLLSKKFHSSSVELICEWREEKEWVDYGWKRR